MIPKKIYYIWGYKEEKSRLANICIENWRDKLQNYEIVEVNEKTPDLFNFDYEYHNNLWFRTVYDLKMWAYISDYMRIKVLYKYGGIYLDTDVTIYKCFDALLDNKMFIGNCLNNIPEIAIFGVVKKHIFLEEMINFYENEVWSSPNFIITKIFSNILKTRHNITPCLNNIVKTEDITIYTPEYFHPYHYDMPFNHDCITKNTFAVHWMASSWHNKINLFFLSNKHRIPLNILLKKMDFIKRTDINYNKKTHVGGE